MHAMHKPQCHASLPQCYLTLACMLQHYGSLHAIMPAAQLLTRTPKTTSTPAATV
jgi:hypothetical protein